MKPAPTRNVERWRITNEGEYSSTRAHGNVGAFRIPVAQRTDLIAVVDDGKETGWEHVACTIVHHNVDRSREPAGRAPTQKEMALVREYFFAPTDVAFEIWFPDHCRDLHPDTRHVWRKLPHARTKLPPPELVSPQLGALRRRLTRAPVAQVVHA